MRHSVKIIEKQCLGDPFSSLPSKLCFDRQSARGFESRESTSCRFCIVFRGGSAVLITESSVGGDTAYCPRVFGIKRIEIGGKLIDRDIMCVYRGYTAKSDRRSRGWLKEGIVFPHCWYMMGAGLVIRPSPDWTGRRGDGLVPSRPDQNLNRNVSSRAVEIPDLLVSSCYKSKILAPSGRVRVPGLRDKPCFTATRSTFSFYTCSLPMDFAKFHEISRINLKTM